MTAIINARVQSIPSNSQLGKKIQLSDSRVEMRVVFRLRVFNESYPAARASFDFRKIHSNVKNHGAIKTSTVAIHFSFIRNVAIGNYHNHCAVKLSIISIPFSHLLSQSRGKFD